MNKETLLDKIFVMFFRIPSIKNYWDRNFEALTFKNIPWEKLKKPLEKVGKNTI